MGHKRTYLYILERAKTVVIQMHTIDEYYCIVLRLELVK